MDWNLTDDQRLIVDMVHSFAEKELKPRAAELDRTGEFPLATMQRLADLGLMGMNVPAAYGGSEAGPVALSLALTEAARGCASTAVTMSVTNMVGEAIVKFGVEEQKRRLLPRLNSGPFPIGSFALTESSSGSDAASLKTRAVLQGDEWVVNGSKIFISHGAYASVMVVWVRTGDAPGADGISALLVERDTPGLIIGKHEDKMGLRGSNTVSLAFEDCRVPRANLLGRPGEGFKIAMMALDGGRIGIGSQAIGIGRAALEAAVDYAKVREQFGQPIGRLGAIQDKIADMATQLEAARALTLRAAWLKETGQRFGREASMAKLYASEALQRIVKEAVQIHGGYGYVKDYVVERLFRDARVATIYEGTSEIQRLVIARELLRD
jgi:alkylation response protein AidB-like acyl-CoA dehydrogenase